ncbi:FAD:protein FMN transferase [Polycladidibacter hongkongensis]|uniref:FAD:protein FMN transferase n=1 Tax=Polycladidibacter hongkongensis TaxID=1647556 RepID=UPI000829DB5F|nr:FAD:protein FMN transferase [Pseudovibrio hongkongensis]
MRFILAIIAVIGLAACEETSSTREQISLAGTTMGTTYSIKAIVAPGSLSAKKLQAEVEYGLKLVNNAMSNWVPTSEVERFNKSRSTEWLPISGDLSNVMQEALIIHSKSGGRFDVTLAPLIDLWGFGPSKETAARPSDAQIRDALSSVGMNTMLEYESNPPALRKVNPETTINLSAIAKGYGIDKMAQVLRDSGFTEFLVEIGGDLYAQGQNARNQSWIVGIERPDQALQQVEKLVRLSDQGMATSGDYRNYREVDGKRVAHIIDAVTGEPISHRLASVTVIAQNATKADGWATAIYALGEERGMEVAEQEGLAVFMIVRDGTGFKQITSSAFSALEVSK